MTMLARRASTSITGNETMLDLDTTLRRGRRGDVVRLVQEWLCLNEFEVMIDGQYGHATAQAVADFQGSTGVLPVTGEVDPQTFALLTRPIAEALRRIDAPRGATLGQLVAAYALQHLRNGAREVGGAHRGPWVRLYLHGDQRPRATQGQAWNAGFVSTMLAQAAAALEVGPPLDFQTNVNRLAEEAVAAKKFMSGDRAVRDIGKITTGSILLLRENGERGKWHHIGIVTQALPKFVRTIEGNAAYGIDEAPSGNAVVRQMRSYGNLDFILL